jgi:hypothetical protein
VARSTRRPQASGELARDNDIRRTVAVKKMIGDAASAETLMRFADEIRVVGRARAPRYRAHLRRRSRRQRRGLPGDEAPPAKAHVPMEHLYIVRRGLERDRNKRTKDVETLENEIKRVLDGHIEIKCHVTLAKSAAFGFGNGLDRNPRLFTMILLAVSCCFVGSLGLAAWLLFKG